MTTDVFEQNVLPFCQIVRSSQLDINIGFLCVYVPVSQIFNFNFFDQRNTKGIVIDRRRNLIVRSDETNTTDDVMSIWHSEVKDMFQTSDIYFDINETTVMISKHIEENLFLLCFVQKVAQHKLVSKTLELQTQDDLSVCVNSCEASTC